MTAHLDLAILTAARNGGTIDQNWIDKGHGIEDIRAAITRLETAELVTVRRVPGSDAIEVVIHPDRQGQVDARLALIDGHTSADGIRRALYGPTHKVLPDWCAVCDGTGWADYGRGMADDAKCPCPCHSSQHEPAGAATNNQARMES